MDTKSLMTELRWGKIYKLCRRHDLHTNVMLHFATIFTMKRGIGFHRLRIEVWKTYLEHSSNGCSSSGKYGDIIQGFYQSDVAADSAALAALPRNQ